MPKGIPNKPRAKARAKTKTRAAAKPAMTKRGVRKRKPGPKAKANR